MEEPPIDDPYDFKPPPGPSQREVRKRWAEEGNVEALLDLVRTTHWGLISIDEQLKNVMRACQVRAKSDPASFARDLFAQMVGFNSFLMLRTQLYVADRVAGRGETPCTPTLTDLPRDVVERFLPRLLELQRSLCEILAAQASTARMWALATSKEARNDRATRTSSDKPRNPRTPPPSVNKSSGTGSTDGRRNGSLNGVASHSGGRRHG